jgi:hypothetical protein
MLRVILKENILTRNDPGVHKYENKAINATEETINTGLKELKYKSK